jgi:hypothetical protein
MLLVHILLSLVPLKLTTRAGDSLSIVNAKIEGYARVVEIFRLDLHIAYFNLIVQQRIGVN